MTTHLIKIKGTRKGIILTLDDEAVFLDVFTELKCFLSDNHLNMKNDNVSITVKLGYRYLKESQESELRSLLENDYELHIENLESKLTLRSKTLENYNKSQIKTFSRIVRSGQTIKVEGSLLLIGDVNPGGRVEASENIFILGELLGIAHAGIKDNNHAIITASFMNPTQLRIGEYISRAPDYDSEGVYLEHASVNIDDKKIILNKIKAFPRIEKELSEFERSLLNG